MSEQEEPNPNRRRFLQMVAWGTAATATGVGAGWLAPKFLSGETAEIGTGTPPVVSVSTLATPSANPSELYGQLVSCQAENMRLQAALDAANRRLTTLEQGRGEATAVELQLQQELADSTQRLTVLAGLMGLYEQLDRLELGDKVAAGIASLGEAFTNLVGDLPSLTDGLSLGSLRLDEFEGHLPLLESGRSWLASHTSKIESYYQLFEQMLQTAVERAAPLLDMLQEWFDAILRWLPFGMGRTAIQVMSALTDLMRETPNTIAGIRTNIAQPLDVWLAKESPTSAPAFTQRLVTPLREQAIQPAQQVVNKAQAAKQVYEDEMVVRLGSAVDNRRIIQQLINEYKEKHGLNQGTTSNEQ